MAIRKDNGDKPVQTQSRTEKDKKMKSNLTFEMDIALIHIRTFFCAEKMCMNALRMPEVFSDDHIKFAARHYARAAYQMRPELRESSMMPRYVEPSLKPRIKKVC